MMILLGHGVMDGKSNNRSDRSKISTEAILIRHYLFRSFFIAVDHGGRGAAVLMIEMARS